MRPWHILGIGAKILLISGNTCYFVARLMRLAAFQNPEFYQAQALRLPTFDKPRVISRADIVNSYSINGSSSYGRFSMSNRT
jgi:hypothetical protein